MEKIILTVFLLLFAGRMTLRYILEQLNMKNLKTRGKDIPSVFQDSLDEATVNKSVDYAYDQSRLESVENLAGDMMELAVIFLLLPALTGFLVGLPIHLIGQALIFFAVLAFLSGVAGLPFDLYHTFVLEKRYGFSIITWQLWVADLIKSAMVSAILMAIIVSALMAFVMVLPGSWWFWGWVFFTFFQLTLLWLYPVLIAPLFNKFSPIKDEGLKEKITAMLAAAGLRTGGIYQVDQGKRSRHTNAYFTGLGKTKRIVLYDTLLQSHTPDEIVAVLAHEIGHWKKKHILKQLAAMTFGSLILFHLAYRMVAWPPLFQAFGIEQTPIWAGLLLVALYCGAAGFFLTPIGTALTRRFEREADRTAFELTGTARPMIDALKRLAKDNLSNLHPHPWYVRFYYSHPPLVERIEYLQAMEYTKGKR